MSKILVTYASKHGATTDIAEKIGDILSQNGHDTDVLPVKDVGSIAEYDAFVIGSAVYVGQWRKEAAKFLKQHADTLRERDVWLFSSGPTGTDEPASLLGGWHFPDKLQPIADHIQPHDITLFHGALAEESLNMLERMMIRAVKAPMDDFRQWEQIKAWAEGISTAV